MSPELNHPLWSASLGDLKAKPYGLVSGSQGLIVEATGLPYPVGTACMLHAQGRRYRLRIVGFRGQCAQLMSLDANLSPSPNQKIYPLLAEQGPGTLPAGMEVLGRVLDPEGHPLDGREELGANAARVHLVGESLNPLMRKKIDEPLDVGVKAINGLLTVGRGQRMGIFAGSGVGKSTLLGMMSRHSKADVVIVALIGERGREVKEFIDAILGPAIAKSVVIAAPADASPLLKMQGAEYACSLAHWFREQGLHCLLIMDSLTRYAMAAREIGLAIGEPPATKGYPPSVFAKIATLIERSGNGAEGSGSITGFYTVLSEGDDMQDPVADTARAILDGHIALSRELAEQGHYPPIDIGASVSRAFSTICSEEHQRAARKFRMLRSAYERNRDLINVGAYSKGSDPATDEALVKLPQINEFLQQNLVTGFGLQQCILTLEQISNA